MEEKVIEKLCQCLGNLCGYEVKCRVFLYKGQKYTIPSKKHDCQNNFTGSVGQKRKRKLQSM
ncbi:MAG: DUF2703 domain-containing protein [Caldimicrobium sp.]